MSKYLNKLKRILVITPDAIGSTYFQRSLTLYLNYHGCATKNYHDLCNFTTDLGVLAQTLSTDITSTIARCSPYRSTEFHGNTQNYLKFCAYFFTDIYVIDRCSFESALSYRNTHANTGVLNVYSKEQYIENKNKEPWSIRDEKFKQTLRYFEDFYIWVDKYFPDHKKINYIDLISDTDNLFKKEFNVYSNKELSIVEYNKFNTLRVRDKDLSSYSNDQLLKFMEITDYLQYLTRYDLLVADNRFPIKKITLKEKIAEITNFEHLLDIYNKYPSNHFEKVTKQDIEDRIKLEQVLWTI